MKHFIKTIKNDFKRDYLDYFLLISAGILFIIGLNAFRGERLIQFIILFCFSSFYIIWGSYHHLIKDLFRLKILLEYIIIAFIALFLLKIILIQ